MGTPLAICLVRISVALRTVVFTKKSGPGAGAYTAAGILVEAADNMTYEGASLVRSCGLKTSFLVWPGLRLQSRCICRQYLCCTNRDLQRKDFHEWVDFEQMQWHGSPAYGIPDESWSPCEDAAAVPGCERALVLRPLPLMILVFRKDFVPADNAGTGAMAGGNAAEAVTCRRHCT
jgi:hypothetical protein